MTERSGTDLSAPETREKRSGVLNTRRSDNLFQLIGITVAVVAGVAIALATHPFAESVPVTVPIAMGVIGGLVVGTFLTGLILMIRNFRR